jgi:hypothetical protein
MTNKNLPAQQLNLTLLYQSAIPQNVAMHYNVEPGIRHSNIHTFSGNFLATFSYLCHVKTGAWRFFDSPSCVLGTTVESSYR